MLTLNSAFCTSHDFWLLCSQNLAKPIAFYYSSPILTPVNPLVRVDVACSKAPGPSHVLMTQALLSLTRQPRPLAGIMQPRLGVATISGGNCNVTEVSATYGAAI